MKRLNALGLMALALLSFGLMTAQDSQAINATPSSYQFAFPIPIRTQCIQASSNGNTKWTNAYTFGYVDSTYWSHSAGNLAATLLTSITDTTVVFSPPKSNTGETSGDSLLSFQFYITPYISDPRATIPITTTADTAVFTLQGSYNGQDWVSFPAVAVVASTGGNTITRAWFSISDLKTSGTPTNSAVFGYPLYRMIIKTDCNGAMQAGYMFATMPNQSMKVIVPPGDK